jgi:methyltransferase-like protein/SAM-dependent methyltransferase
MPESPRLAAPTSRSNSSSNSYDEVPYDSHPYMQTHPSRLSTVATLFGMNPPPLEKCRVLELGCASGGNIVPMAEGLPESWFVGVDYSARQIADGERMVRHSGLRNVSLRHASILDVDDTYGPFDYIICHGVFSWVPDAVREKILAICSKHLTLNGVAYVSYNTYPGWHMRGLIRDMMRFHALRFDTPTQRVQQARALLDFLVQSTPKDGSAYSVLLRGELESLRHQADPYLYHEHLEEVNDPLYFHQFIELAARHKLRYLGEARLTTMISANFGPDVQKALAVVASDQTQSEQYLDFVRNRTFRETLLVRADSIPNWSIQPDAVHRLHVTTPRRLPADSTDVRLPTTAQYQTLSGMTLSTSSPVLKAAMRILRERWPATVPFADLDRAVAEMLGNESDGGKTLALGLLNTYLAADLLELHAAPVRLVTASERPVALASARARLALGEGSVATRRHELYKTNDFTRALIPLLDGTHDQTALLDALTKSALAGELTVAREGQPLRDPEGVREALAVALAQALNDLADLCLLRES